MANRALNGIIEPHQTTLWLAARDGTRLAGPDHAVAPVGDPETLLEVEFIGLTEAEQRAALAAFPGGKRFILKHPH